MSHLVTPIQTPACAPTDRDSSKTLAKKRSHDESESELLPHSSVSRKKKKPKVFSTSDRVLRKKEK